MPTQRFAAVLCSSLVFALAAQARAADADAVAPYVGEETVAVVRLDLEKLDLVKLVEWYGGSIQRANAPADVQKEVKGGMGTGAAMMQGMIKRVQDQGVRQVLVVVNLDQQYRPRFVLVAPAPGKMADAKALAESMGLTVLSAEQNLAVTDPQYARLANQIKVAAREDLSASLKGDAGGAAIAVSAGLHPTLRDRILKEYPQIKTPDGAVDSAVLLDGMRQVQLQLAIAPAIGVKYKIKSKDADAAAAIKKWIDDGAKSQKADKSWSDLIELASPKQMGDELSVDLKEADLDKLVVASIPAMVQARLAANRVKSASNIRQLLLGCMMHMNENQGVAPATLDALAEQFEGHAQLKPILVNPLRPELKEQGYVYLPALEGKVVKIKQPSQRIAIYEAGDFGQGLNVGFWDGHVEFIADKARFEKMLAEAKGK